MVNTSSIIGQHLQRYQITERLGTGGMATVYRAVDLNLRRDVAIKVLHDHLVHDDTFKDRFSQEARFIAGFNHPNIVQVYDFDTIDTTDGKLYYMVMPFLSGETLASKLKSCRSKEETLSHEDIKNLIGDLAQALDYAHERGMVHRDVKPANIIFDENDRAILTDFGIARLAETSGLTQDGTIVGTPAYMSPEQATGQDTDFQSDIYSLGVILYELLTGRTPFNDESTVALLLKHAQTAPPLVSQFMENKNSALDRVLQKVLEKNPSDRYQSATALYDALEDAISKESDTERYQPAAMPHHGNQRISKQPATEVLTDTPFSEEQDTTNTITRTINTLVIKPAKQNPLGFAALAIAIVALLLIARMTQNTPIQASPTEVVVSNGVESMAGIDEMVGDAAFFSGDFSEDDGANEYWEITVDAPIQRIIENDEYRITNTIENLGVTSLFDPNQFSYDDVNITMTGTILETSAGESSNFGIIFNYQDAQNYNVFTVDGRGRFGIWRRESGIWCELRTDCNGGEAAVEWQSNDAIQTIGEENTLNINVYRNQIAGYVNDELLFMMEEGSFDRGAIGVYMASTGDGRAEVSVDTYAVTLGIPTTDSMAGDEG